MIAETLVGAVAGGGLVAAVKRPRGWVVEVAPDPEGMEIWMVRQRLLGRRRVLVRSIGFQRDKSLNPQLDFEELYAIALAEARSQVKTMNTTNGE